MVVESNEQPKGEPIMKKFQLIAGIVSLGLAIILALLDLLKIDGVFANTAYTVYPAAAFCLLGLVLLFRYTFKQPKA
jgi:hypothetical protein